MIVKKVSIIIPIFNEENTVLELLKQVFNQPLPGDLKKELVIIESNSTDKSRHFVHKFCKENARAPGVELQLILEEGPKGKGHATRKGIAAATGEIILIQDADLEYDVSDYPQLIQPILDGHADFVLGSRHLSAGTWKIRKFSTARFKGALMNLGGQFFHTFFNIMFQVHLTDPTTMYKVFLRDCIRGVEFSSNRFDFDWELVAKLIRLGFTPLEVPVSYKSRGFDQGKKISFWRDPFTYLRAIILFRFKRIRRTPRFKSGELGELKVQPDRGQ